MKTLNTLKLTFIMVSIAVILGALIAAGSYFYLNPKLPSIEGLSDVQLQVPLRIYSSDGVLLGEFGEKRRTPKTLDEIPERMRQAFLAAEDSRFFEHPGVDYQGILRAALNLAMTGERGQGGSTITMQLARNFYLSSEKTYLRKINEILLALKIERELSKEKILELYLNKIYLGNRSYGVAAAAQTYYGVDLDGLTLPQIAMIAGLPKAPSTYNPIVNPERATIRRNYVLSRMQELGFISPEEYTEAQNAPVTAERHSSAIGVYAPYVNEMARREIVRQFGDEAYVRGLKVYTTINKRLQEAANNSLWQGLVDYDRRHGYRGVIRHVDLESLESQNSPENTQQGSGQDDADQVDTDLFEAQQESDQSEADSGSGEKETGPEQFLEDEDDYGRFKPGLVVSVHDDISVADKPFEGEVVTEQPEDNRSAVVLLKDGTHIRLPWEGIEWARKYISVNRVGDELKTVSEVIKPGDIIWVYHDADKGWQLGQIPEIQGALVSVDPNTGAIQALVGGFNFEHSKFNRVTQMKRQAGSGFKPIVYSAGLAKQYTPASLINDAPVVFEDKALEGAWRPENYSGKTFGPTRLRKALYKSRNLVSIRLLNAIGISYATKFAENFGLDASELPHDLSLALGSAALSPLQMVRAYSVFANGGYLIKPYLIQRIVDADGTSLYEADPAVACASCVIQEQKWSTSITSDDALTKLPKQAERTLEPRLTFQMNSILQDVILRGTGVRARSLGRKDLAGKTGTTNDQRDAWFNGFNPDLVATAWVGFDQLQPLGNRETGGHAALPIWIDFMGQALAGRPEKFMEQPDGLVTMKINAETGLPAKATDTDTVFEIFRKENVPSVTDVVPAEIPVEGEKGVVTPEQLF